MCIRDRNKWLYPDGFGYMNGMKTAFLYHGCAWHGHKGCNKGKGTLHGVSAVDRYNLTMKQEDRYKEAGFNVIRVWECEWKMQKEEIIQDPNHTDKNIIISEYIQRLSNDVVNNLSLIHISEPTRLLSISYAVFC